MGRSEKRALVAVIVALGFTTLAIASASCWAACLASGLAIAAVIPLIRSRRQLHWPQPLLLLLSIPLVATLIQLLPLPGVLVHSMSPDRYDLAEANARAFGYETPRFLALTYDWPATLLELAKFSGYFAFAYVCTRLCHSQKFRSAILTTVVAIATVVCALALGHRALGMKSLLGFYEPTVLYHNSLTVFLNPNHLAGYTAFAAPLALALAVHRRSWLFLASGILCVATSIQADSRAGLVALMVGLTLFSLLLAKGRAPRQGRSGPWLYPGIVAAMLLLAGLILLTTGAGHELLTLDFQREQDAGKFTAWLAAVDAIGSSPWTGMGRGAFEIGFAKFQPAMGVTFSHLENEYLQAVVDWGIPVALAMLAAALLLGRRIIAKTRDLSPLHCGAISALASILVQSSLDFGLELPGMALPTIAVAASLVSHKLAKQSDKSRIRRAVAVRAIAVVAGLAVCGAAISSLSARPAAEIGDLPEFSSNFSGSNEQIRARAAQLSKRHPASYLVAATTAQALWARRDSTALAYLARALDRNPNHYGVHYLAAKLLETTQQPRQALAEYRKALQIPGGDKYAIVASLVARFPDASDLALAMAQQPKIELRYARILVSKNRARAAWLIGKRSLERGNLSFAMTTVAVQAAITSKQLDWAQQTAKEAHRRIRTSASLLLWVRVLEASSQPSAALKQLEQWRAAGPKQSELPVLVALARLQMEAGSLALAEPTIREILAARDASPQMRKAAQLQLAKIEESRGNRHKAAWHRQQAKSLK